MEIKDLKAQHFLQRERLKREVEEMKNGGRAFERVKRLRKHVMAARGGGWSGKMQAEVLSKQRDNVHLLKI